MIRVFSSTIALATRFTASCAVRFGRYPYDPDWKSASKIGSRMSLSAPWTTRSRIAGIERTRTFLPPSLGISFFRARMGRYVFEISSSRVLQTVRCLCHLTLASHVVGTVTNSRVPLLHRHYSVSPLLRTHPSPSRRFPTSRFRRLYGSLLRRFPDGARRASPVARHILVIVLSLLPRQSSPPHRSDCDVPCCLRSMTESSASGANDFEATSAFTFVTAR